ncbi:peptidylprolyl isomerase [Candidatus Pelagibacter sp.]|nr:peptidylprolyl isomerase [Candidatus Pelagibacter sp.]
MIKVLLITLFVIKLSLGIVFAEDQFKIILKVNKRVITNIDVSNERKYLATLNPQISNLSEKDILKISKESLIKEIIKEDEVLKYYEIDYSNSDLINTSNILPRLNMQNENQFKDYLSQNDISLKEVNRKLAVEASWNRLIFEMFKDQVSIDEEKIKKNLNNSLKNTEAQKTFLLSELLFAADNKDEFENKYQEIIEAIETQGFKNAVSIYSIAPSNKYGGEIGWVRKNQVSKEIISIVDKLKKDDISKPLKIPSGFLIIKLVDVKNEKIKINYDEELLKIINSERNRQLNQFSSIYYKKIQRNSYIDEQ